MSKDIVVKKWEAQSTNMATEDEKKIEENHYLWVLSFIYSQIKQVLEDC